MKKKRKKKEFIVAISKKITIFAVAKF